MSDTSEIVTLTRAEYEALIERLEDAEDLAAVAAAEAREAALGKEKVRANYLPIELVRRLSAGEHPVRVWRAHRRLSREALATAAGIDEFTLRIDRRHGMASRQRHELLPPSEKRDDQRAGMDLRGEDAVDLVVGANP